MGSGWSRLCGWIYRCFYRQRKGCCPFEGLPFLFYLLVGKCLCFNIIWGCKYTCFHQLGLFCIEWEWEWKLRFELDCLVIRVVLRRLWSLLPAKMHPCLLLVWTRRSTSQSLILFPMLVALPTALLPSPRLTLNPFMWLWLYFVVEGWIVVLIMLLFDIMYRLSMTGLELLRVSWPLSTLSPVSCWLWNYDSIHFKYFWNVFDSCANCCYVFWFSHAEDCRWPIKQGLEGWKSCFL